MAYNPNFYNQYYPNGYAPVMPQVQQPVQPVQPQQQIVDGGFVVIPREDMVSTYPVGPGRCVKFKIEGKPIIIEKTMGFSQFDDPKIERYRLVKEDAPEDAPEGSNLAQGDIVDLEPINSTLDDIKGQIEDIWGEIEGIKNDRKSENASKRNSRRDRNGDDRYDGKHE